MFCFIFSLAEIKYDAHKAQSLPFIAAYQKKKLTKQHETNDSNNIQNQKSMLIQHVLAQGSEAYIYSDDDYTGSRETKTRI